MHTGHLYSLFPLFPKSTALSFFLETPCEAVRNLIEAEPQATAEAETAALLTGRKLWEEPNRQWHASDEYIHRALRICLLKFLFLI